MVRCRGTRRSDKRGTRPSAPKDQRTRSAYIYGAICPAEGKGAGLVHPRCNTQGMTLHLAEISAAVAPGAHAVLLLDQVGWHGSRALVVPGNITLMPLPSKCPEVNLVENVRRFMRDNWLSNRVFKSCDDILGELCRSVCELGRIGSDQRVLISESGPMVCRNTSSIEHVGYNAYQYPAKTDFPSG